MNRKNRNSIASCLKLPQFITMNVIDGQAGLVRYYSLIFYSLTINNILNIIVLLILAGIGISVLTQTGLFDKAKQAKEITDNKYEEENTTLAEYNNKINEVFNTRENNSNNSYTEEEQVVGSWKDGKKYIEESLNLKKHNLVLKIQE